MATCIEARHLPGERRSSLYGKEWELCEGTEGASQGDLNLLRTQWNADERESFGRVVSEYRLKEIASA